ncbi:MAG: DoxX family protein [Planctomycetales bacterium]|nr:DoxX family protein [Planctomycetales bacterium]
MAKSETSSSGQCPTSSGVAWKVIVAIVLLRLCIGWHFLSEGAKKLSYDRGSDSWSINVPTAAMLGQAKGPLAGFIQHQLPGGHGWQSLLAVPQEMTPEAGQQLNDWVAEYVKRRQAELSKGEHKPVEIPDFAPYANWYEQIIADWKAIHTSFTKVSGLKKEQLAEAATLFEVREQFLADYLAEESLDIQAYQHELWRLAQAASQGENRAPFEQERIADKTAEVGRTPLKWVAGVRQLQAGYLDELRGVLTDKQRDSAMSTRVESALVTPKERNLAWVNLAVTCLTVGVGICLLAGFCTRLAAIAGALFLLTIMATQPPWVLGAKTDFFYYQLVEVAAFLFLAAVGAGRWAGLDSIVHCLWSKCCGTKAS